MKPIDPSVAKKIALAVFDVDGVMTDGKITYTSNGEETKSFDIRDGLGIKLLSQAGITVAIVTGRHSPMVKQRALDLGIGEVIQGREDKLVALSELCTQRGIELDAAAYMGDDLPDLSAVASAGLGAAPANGHPTVKGVAKWITESRGGDGAVREFAEALLLARGQWQQVVEEFSR
jgi:3-deoxy-D-manno-octulosonate 8-phosphate phosphatase (KDO 8-P phosphatase)